MMDEQKETANNTPPVRTAEMNSDQISFVAILFFVLGLAFAAILLIAAAVVWVADMLGSLALSCLIFGGAAAIIALIIYLCSVRRSIRIMHDWFGTVYETSRIAKSGYERIKSWFELIFG